MKPRWLSLPLDLSLAVALWCPLLVACSGGKSDDTGSGTADSTDDTGSVDHSVAPTIVSVDTVNCAEYQSAGESWDLALTVADPQGANTVTDGSVSVLSSAGGELASYVLACTNGQCVGSFRAAYDGIGCSSVGEVTLRFIVSDLDGNTSAPTDYPT